MTERERITLNLEICRESVARTQRDLDRLKTTIQEYEKELAALPPDKPDLSAWRPSGWGGLWFVGDSGKVEGVNAGFLGSDDPNAYQTRAEAERAAKRQHLHTRLWQCYERLYEADGFVVDDREKAWFIYSRSSGRYSTIYLPALDRVTGIPQFKTEQDAQWVIEQLQSEGLL